MDVFNLILLVGCSLVCVLALIKSFRSQECCPNAVPTGSEWERLAGLLALVLFAIALLLRLYRFGTVPDSMNQDGAMAAVDALALSEYGTDRFGMRLPVHLTAWGYGQMSAMLSYMQAPLIKLFGLSVVTARLPLLIASMAGLLCLYLFSRDVFGALPALAVLFFAAVDPWHFMQSRWALDCNLFPHFLCVGLFMLNRGLEKRGWLYASMAVFGLSMYCYGISIYTVPVFLSVSCVYLLVKRVLRPWEALLCVLAYLLTAWPFIAVMAINYFELPTVATPLFTLPYFSGSVRSHDILFFSEDLPAQLLTNVRALFKLVVLQSKDLPWNDIEGFGTMYLFSAPFFITGLVCGIREAKRRSDLTLSLILLLTGVWAGLVTNGVNVNRENIIFYPLILFTGLGIYYSARALPFARIAVPAVYLTAFVLFCTVYFGSFAQDIETYFLKDFETAVSSVKDEDVERIYITVRSQSDSSAAVSEILTLFCHETDALYFQGKTEVNGRSYSQTYCYTDMKDITPDPGEDAVYVASLDESGVFDPERFDFEYYGRYFVARPIR